MAQLILVLFYVALAYNAYRAAKRSGQWSWPQFFVVVSALIAMPLTILWVLSSIAWLQDKPVAFTVIATSLIIVSVCALAYALKKFWPLKGTSRP